MAGNMKGVGSVNGEGLSAPEPEVAVEVEYYTIKSVILCGQLPLSS